MGLVVILIVIVGLLLLLAAVVDHRDKKRGQHRRSMAELGEMAVEGHRDARALDRRSVGIQDDISWTDFSRRGSDDADNSKD